jgi:hypothetical protein
MTDDEHKFVYNGNGDENTCIKIARLKYLRRVVGEYRENETAIIATEDYRKRREEYQKASDALIIAETAMKNAKKAVKYSYFKGEK